MNINQLNKLPTFVLALLIVILNGFVSLAFSQQNDITVIDSTVQVQTITKKEVNPDSLLQFAKRYLGTPYRLSGKTSKGFDCSGFVHYVYKRFDVKVPYSCPAISSACPVKVTKTELQKGDLLFFKGSNIKSKAIGHIAIVYAVEDGKIRMIHSCRRGVILETLNESKYYKARYLFAKRILCD
ncbi:MAG TPA: C40 family peptidase [Cytophagaceae bacterium]|jgi:cell wall-associated NlpC family hydrolase|nr:C40 family peptidase [Cytophagaceae bacterium]